MADKTYTKEFYEKNKASLRTASKNYDENKVESIRLRVPMGWKEQIEARAQEYPAVNSKGKHSVNTYLCDLVAKDLGIENNAD